MKFNEWNEFKNEMSEYIIIIIINKLISINIFS